MSVPVLKGIHRRALGLTKDDQVIAQAGFVAGGDGRPAIVFPSPDTVAIFDDFMTDLSGTGAAVDTGAAGQFFLAKCTDTGVKGSLVAGTNGVYEITSSASITTPTPTGSSKIIVGKQLAWKA